MKKVPPIRIKFVYIGTHESEKRLKMAYHRIFEIARRNLFLTKNKRIGGDNNVSNN